MEAKKTINKAIQAVTAFTNEELATLLDRNPEVHGRLTLELVFVNGHFDRLNVSRGYGIKMDPPKKN